MKTIAQKIYMLIAAANFFLLPQLSHALTITGVDVDILLNAANGGGTRNYSIWDGQIGGGVVLTPGQQLILTQNSGYRLPHQRRPGRSGHSCDQAHRDD